MTVRRASPQCDKNSALNELEARGFIKIGYGRIDILDSAGLDALAVSDPAKIG